MGFRGKTSNIGVVQCINVLFSASLNFVTVISVNSKWLIKLRVFAFNVSAQDVQSVSSSWKYGPQSFEFHQPADVSAIL